MPPLRFRPTLCLAILAATAALTVRAHAGNDWLPLVPADAGDAGELYIVNPNAEPVTVSLQAFGPDFLPLYPDTFGNVVDRSIGAGGTLRVPFAGGIEEPAPAGAVQIASTDQLENLITFVEVKGGDAGRCGTYARDVVRRSKNVVLPGLENRLDGSVNCRVALVNLDPTFNPITDMITITVEDPVTGGVLFTDTQPMPEPFRRLTYSGDDLGIDGPATVRIDASRGILADAIVRRPTGRSFSTGGRDTAEDTRFWYPFWRGASFDGSITLLGSAVSNTYSGESLLFDRKGTPLHAEPFSVLQADEVVISGATAAGGDDLAETGVLCEEISVGSAPRAPQIRIQRTGGDFAYVEPMRLVEPGEHGFCPIPGDEPEVHANSVLLVHATPSGDAVGELRLRDAEGRVLLAKRLVVRRAEHLVLPLKKLIGKRRRSAVTAEIVNPLEPLKAGKVTGGGDFQASVIVSTEKVGTRRPKGTGDQLSVLPFVARPYDPSPTVIAAEFVNPENAKRGFLLLGGRGANVGRKASIRVRRTGSGQVLGVWNVKGRTTIKLKLKQRAAGTKAVLGDVWQLDEEREIELIDNATGNVSAAVTVRRGELPVPE